MAAGNTYTPIATQTLGSSASSITFSSISGSYTDLVLIANPHMTAAATAYLYLQFNGDTATNYSVELLKGNGTTATAVNRSGETQIRTAEGAYMEDVYSTVILNIMNYANATTNKTVITRTSHAPLGVELSVGMWRSTAAITSVLLKPHTGSFDIGSTFTLYGIAAA